MALKQDRQLCRTWLCNLCKMYVMILIFQYPEVGLSVKQGLNVQITMSKIGNIWLDGFCLSKIKESVQERGVLPEKQHDAEHRTLDGAEKT